MNVNKLNQMFAMILTLSVAGACNPQPQEIKVRLSSVENATIVESSEFIASSESLCSPTLKPPIKSQISKIFVKLGDRVAAETPLIQLIPAQQASLAQTLNISAPCTGIISDISVSEGENVSTSTPLITLVQIQPLEIRLLVPVERASQLHVGMPVELIDTQEQHVESLKVTAISPQVTAVEQVIRVKARFDNTAGQLRPGQFVRAKLIWGQRLGFLIPASAVTRVSGRTLVFVAQSQGESNLIAQQRMVELGNIQGNQYQVISGLQPGEKLIVSDVRNLTDGAAITPE
jgi:multidrug efflux pump subunit AcrA (membrane-fusion protein)